MDIKRNIKQAMHELGYADRQSFVSAGRGVPAGLAVSARQKEPSQAAQAVARYSGQSQDRTAAERI